MLQGFLQLRAGLHQGLGSHNPEAWAYIQSPGQEMEEAGLSPEAQPPDMICAPCVTDANA